MEEISKTITYDNLCLIEVVEKVHEFLVSSPMQSTNFVREIKLHRSDLGYPIMTIKYIEYNQI